MDKNTAVALIDELRIALGTPRFVLSVGGDAAQARALIDAAFAGFVAAWERGA